MALTALMRRVLRSFATQRESYRVAHELHFLFAYFGQSTPNPDLRDGHDIVKINDARRLQSIVDVELNFGGHVSYRGSERRNRDAREIFYGRATSQQQNRSGFVRRGELVETNLAAL